MQPNQPQNPNPQSQVGQQLPPGYSQPTAPQNPNTVYQGDTTLPPPGYQREETLKQRADNLEQEKQKYDGMAMGVDPNAFEVDREIRYEIERGSLDVPNAQPGYVYCWVQCQYPAVNPTLNIERKMIRMITVHRAGGSYKVPVWEIVTSKMPEAKGLRTNANGHCYIGDTILMRCRQDVHTLIKLYERKRKLEIRRNTDAALVETALQAQRRGAKVSAGQDTYNKYREDANQILQVLDQQIREGTIPGVQINK